MKGALALAATFLLMPSGLGGSAAQEEDPRRWIGEPVRSLEITDLDGSRFGNPWFVAALPGDGFVVVDDGTRLLASSSDGSPLWSFGRAGGGPGEFRSIQDVVVLTGGELLVLDGEQARITVLNPESGELTGTETVPVDRNARASELLASSDFAIVQSEDTWLVLDANGQVVETFRLPVECEGLLCEAHTATGAGGSVVAFRWSSDLVFLNADGSVRLAADGIEPSPLPETVKYDLDPDKMGMSQFATLAVTKVDPKAVESTRSVAVDESRTFVLALGETDDRGRLVDVYGIQDGAYQGSFLVPDGEIVDIALLADGRLATLHAGLVTKVILWKMPL